MLNNLFKQKFPFSANYFSNLLEFVFENKRTFPQSIIFEGADTISQYLFSLELARILNCTGDKSQNCDCINCRWIRSFSHPAVNNVSQIHFKGDDDETKTVISSKQAREIEKSLLLSCDYHRFFIFFSSSDYCYDENELNDFRTLNYQTNINYSIQPLNFDTFHPTTPNALLKSIEEPPNKVTFIFLTKSKENILSTIVSRSQVFKLSGDPQKLDYSDIKNLFGNYFNLDYKTGLNLSDEIQKYIKENQMPLCAFLDKFLEYLKDILKQNLQNENIYQKITNDINLINLALKQSRAKLSDKIVLDTLFLSIVRGY